MHSPKRMPPASPPRHGALALRDRQLKLILGTESSGGHQGVTGEWQPNAGGFDRPESTSIGQLYPIDQGPGERTNLWKDPRDVVKRLSTRLHQAMTQGFTRDMKIDSARP